MQDLKKRLLPAIVAIMVLLLLIQWNWGFALIILICSAGLHYECYKLSLTLNNSYKTMHGMINAGAFVYVIYSLLMYTWPNFFYNNGWTPTLPWSTWIYLAALLTLFFPKILKTTWGIINVFYPILGILSILQLVYINGYYNTSMLVFILINVWAADAFAYLGGSMMGGKKLAPNISPNKTISGWLSALVGVSLVSYIYGTYWLHWSIPITFSWIITIWLTASLGDLFESNLKRQAGVKDSGYFLPGHGGFLDRLDSLIYTAPFALYILKSL